MKTLALVASFALAAAIGGFPRAAAQESCRIERVTYRVGGLQLVGWIMKPAREGRFPVVVWNHGAKAATAQLIDEQVINESTPCLTLFISKGWMIFFTQTRGYGGSEGPRPDLAFRQAPLAFVIGRADDINGSVEWLRTRSDVIPDCIANTGWSQGAVSALLALGKKPALYRATIGQAPGPLVADGAVIQAYRDMRGPILVQANTADQEAFVEVIRVAVRELRRWGRSVEYREYTHPSGHAFFNLANRPDFVQIWGPDAVAFLDKAFAECGGRRS